MKRLWIGTSALLLQVYITSAQNDFTIDDYLESYIGENAVSFVQPLADIYTTSINTGIWEWSKMDKKLYLTFKVQGMISYPTESMKTFVGTTSGDFRPQQSAMVPTIIGDETSIVVYGEENSYYVFPGGYDLNAVTLGVPQLTLGGFLNSEISIRYVTFPLREDQGKVNYYGIGGRHSLTNYFKDAPFDFSVGYMYQQMEAGTYIHTEQHLISGILGKSTEFISAHIMVGYQASDSDLHYVYDDGDNQYNVDLNVDNTNPWIMEGGISFRLKPLMIFGTASYSGHTTLSAGFGLTF